MLKLAYPYQDALNATWQSIAFREKYQFYNTGKCWYYKIELADNSWDNIQMVSIGASEKILGFFSANIDRQANKVQNVGAINFGDLNIAFSKDFYQFLTELFTKHHFRKVEWRVVVGNPAERMYDKIIDKYGGRIIGIRSATTITADGVLRDEKEYELFREDFYARIGGRAGWGGRKMSKRICIPTKMTVMPKSCAECELRRRSHFSDAEACHETGGQIRGFRTSRPLWCPLKEMEEIPNE